MTRATVIVSLWLLLTGSIGEELLSAGRSRVGLLAFYLGISILTALALWLQFREDEDAPRAGRTRRRRERFYHYD